MLSVLTANIRDKNIWRIYRAVLLLGVAYGLAVAVISLHLDALGFHKETIGGLAAWFASGIVLLAVPAGRLVRVFGGKRTLTASLFGYAASVTIFPLLTSFAAIAAARFVDGACSACLWVSFETILLRRADETNKAHVMSVYAMAMAIGYVLGPLAANGVVKALPLPAAFVVSGIVAALAATYVGLRLEPDAQDRARAAGKDPHAEGSAATPTGTILKQIKTSCFATFAYGYFEASVVLFLPLYLTQDKGIARDQTIAIPAFFAAGMLLFSNVAGRLGDRLGHLFLMRILAAIGGATILGFVALGSFGSMAAAVFVAGATLASISPVSLALQGVVTARPDYDRANGMYNAFYAAGILLGPPISSVVFERWGGAPMLFHLAALWAAFVVFAAVFAADDPASRRARRALTDVSPEPTEPG
ncbi:MAG TPA: MFS transporter [Polyangiaceae bacterium]